MVTGSRTSIATIALLLAWASVSPAQTIRIRCGVAGSYTASDATVWQGDQYSTGGVQLYTGYSVIGTPDPTLYRYGRQGYYGDFSYNIPVANGNYQLTLKFAEIQYSSRGQRVFNVTVNGTPVLTNFDIVAQAGYWTAIDKQFPVTVAGGSVQISVHGITSVGLVNAIQTRTAGDARITVIRQQPQFRGDHWRRQPGVAAGDYWQRRRRNAQLDGLEDAAMADSLSPVRHGASHVECDGCRGESGARNLDRHDYD